MNSICWILNLTNITFKSRRGPLTNERSATNRMSICHYEKVFKQEVRSIDLKTLLLPSQVSATYLAFVHFIYNDVTDSGQLFVFHQPPKDDSRGAK